MSSPTTRQEPSNLLDRTSRALKAVLRQGLFPGGEQDEFTRLLVNVDRNYLVAPKNAHGGFQLKFASPSQGLLVNYIKTGHLERDLNKAGWATIRTQDVVEAAYQAGPGVMYEQETYVWMKSVPDDIRDSWDSSPECPICCEFMCGTTPGLVITAGLTITFLIWAFLFLANV